jgi:outer membrane protein OmpA-like peptidoglycan-associated protein
LDQVPQQVNRFYTPEFTATAARTSETLIELVRADNPELADRLAGKIRAVTPTLTATQIQAAPDIGNLQVRGEVAFATGSAQLTPQGKQTLDQLIQEINEFNTATVAVRVIGHTSRTGAANFNQTLSQQRAQSVVAYLQGKGVKHNILAEGKGFNQPLSGIPAEDPRNQRTEIRLVRVN